MDELGPQELEELVQEVEGESGTEDAPSPEVEQLLRDLDPERPMELKVEAVRHLGELSSSNPQIVKALADASMWDANPQFRRLAAAALLALAHQAVVAQHPELLPRYVANLLQEIQEAGVDVAEPDLQEVEASRQEVPANRTENLLHALERASSVPGRARAAQRLGQVEESSLEIVEALIAAREDEPFYTVRKAAEEALRAPVHEAVLQQDAGLMERARQEAAPRDWESELVASPAKPERFRVEGEGGTLSLSWKDGVLHKVLSAGLTALLILAFGYALFAGTYSGENVGIVALALLLPGYWTLVAFGNSTQIKLGPGEWTFQRGPFPFPNRRFYSGRARIDPAAYIEIRTVQVAEKKRGAYGGGTSSGIEGVIAEVLVGALVEQFMEPRITYSLYARAKDGSDKLLLDRLEGHEADYLKHTLQDMLDTEYLASMQEEPGEHMDGEAAVKEASGPADVEALAKGASEATTGPVDPEALPVEALEESETGSSAPVAREVSQPVLDWRFWLDFAAAGLLGGLTLGALGGFVAGLIPVPILGGVVGGGVGGYIGARVHGLGLRRYVALSWRWVFVCCVIAAATWAIATIWSISIATVSPVAATNWLSFSVIAREVEVWVASGVLAGAVGGVVSGIMQVRTLRQRVSRVANWWLLPNTVGWAAGGAVFLPAFWASSMVVQWSVYLLGGGNPPYTLESAFRNNAAICAPVCGLLLLAVPIWARIQAIRQR